MTYTPVWTKYLPVIRLLMKKSVAGEQTLNMNSIDFHRYGASRKAGYKFKLTLSNGRIENMVNTVSMAKELSAVLLEDPTCKQLAIDHDFELSMNAKFQLTIKCHHKEKVESTDTVEENSI